MSYHRRPSALHAARAVVGSVYCVALAALALSVEHPLLLAAVLVAVLAAANAARVGAPVARAVAWALPFGLVIALVNALVVRDGITVIARLGELPPFAPLDVTLEATAYGAVLGLRAVIVIACFALHTAAIDPDDLLRAFRRLSFRSALTAVLATRLVPVLTRDARRLHEAQRCRSGRPASRLAIFRAVTAGALDRAVDVAATLEVRGYGSARRPPRRARPWSRHDAGFAVAALALAALATGTAVFGWDPFHAYPRTLAPVDAGVLAVAAAVLLCALAPFAERRGVGE